VTFGQVRNGLEMGMQAALRQEGFDGSHCGIACD
jgi:hypothetical protein